MRKLPVLLVVPIVLLLSFGRVEASLFDQLSNLQKKINQTRATIYSLQKKEDSLINQIAYLDNQINLSRLEIKKAKTEIKLLSKDIGDISRRLGRIDSLLVFQEKTFVARARSAYIADQLSAFDIILGSSDLEGALRRIKYLKVLETQDKAVLEQMRDIRIDYKGQKSTLEGKKASVEELKRKVEEEKANLENQKTGRSYLLGVTRNQEADYQRLLEQYKAELAAVQAAIAARGVKIGKVKRGDIIAFEGNTGCVCSWTYGCAPQSWPHGSHLHFVVVKDGNIVNPLPYLQSGKLKWPENMGAAVITQYYHSRHLAIDMAYPLSYGKYERPIYAAADGTAYLTGDAYRYYPWCNGRATGIKVVHDNGLTTLYWHVQKF